MEKREQRLPDTSRLQKGAEPGRPLVCDLLAVYWLNPEWKELLRLMKSRRKRRGRGGGGAGGGRGEGALLDGGEDREARQTI